MKPILFVDLDESLIKTDILREQLTRSFATCPWWTVRMLFRQNFRPEKVKAAAAGKIDIDSATLPYNADVLALIRKAKQEGRPVVLATATHNHVAQKIAGYLGFFDAVLATTDAHNCKGSAKLAAMQAFAEGRPFDYVGDSRADLKIFKETRMPYIVGGLRYAQPHQRLARPSPLKPFLKAMRPRKWAKNSLVFLPLLMAHPLTWPTALGGALGFACFSLVASAVYVIQGMASVEDDRHHPEKKERPFARGDLTIDEGIGFSVSLLAAAIALSCFWKPSGLWVLGGYVLLALTYAFSLKNKPVLKVLGLGCLYALRIAYGFAILWL